MDTPTRRDFADMIFLVQNVIQKPEYINYYDMVSEFKVDLGLFINHLNKILLIIILLHLNLIILNRLKTKVSKAENN